MLLACAFLCLFAAVATTDSMYFHVWKYRLHNRPESRFEHLMHTANICLFVPTTYLLFCVNARGDWLVAAVALLALTLCVELADVLCENDSRRSLGGLIPSEYAMHFLMSGLRMGFVGAYFASGRIADLAAPTAIAGADPRVRLIGWFMVAPGALVAALHVALVFTGRRQIERDERAARAQSTTAPAIG